jgi:hypothetical protein
MLAYGTKLKNIGRTLTGPRAVNTSVTRATEKQKCDLVQVQVSAHLSSAGSRFSVHILFVNC